MFYLDVVANDAMPQFAAALSHLHELAEFVRVLGCFPKGGMLVHQLQQSPLRQPLLLSQPLQRKGEVGQAAVTKAPTGLRIGIVGFGTFGQFLARTFARSGQNQL